MTKQEKIKALENAMESRLIDNERKTQWYFRDETPQELTDLFLKECEIRDIDYETFSKACDLLTEIYNDEAQENDGLEFVEDAIYDASHEYASVYTSDRLSHLTIENQDEVSEILKREGCDDIAQACAVWFGRKVEEHAILINKWINS